MAVVAGVDSSTQSCTVELRDASSGALLGVGRAPHPPTHPPVSEQHPSDWWAAFEAAFANALADAQAPGRRVRAISVGAQCHGMVLLDASGRVLRPAKLWNDTTSAPDVARLLAQRPQSSWVAEMASPLNPAFTIAKLAWMARCEPETLAKTAHVLVPADYLTWRLTGELATDRSNASGTGYYSAPRGEWLTDLLAGHVSADVAWPALLPSVLGPQDRAGVVRPEVADRLGLAPGVVVGPGGGDQHLGAAGMGLRPGEVAFSLGTSGVVMTPAGPPPEPPWDVDYVCDATGGYLPLVCVLNCAKVTDWCARLLGVGIDELDQMALSAPVRGRIDMLAYLDGERNPMRPDASGALRGLRTDTSREELALACFDAVAQGLVWGMGELSRLVGAPITSRVLAVGGGARSRAYKQLIADRCGEPVTTIDAPEATARGACVQAAAVLAGETVARVRDDWAPDIVGATAPRADGPKGLSPGYLELREAARDWVR